MCDEQCVTVESVEKEFVFQSVIDDLRAEATRMGINDRKLGATVRAEYTNIVRSSSNDARVDLHALIEERAKNVIRKSE